MKNKIYFITFGSHDNYVEAGNRLIEQATKLNIFDEIKLITKDDNDFWNKHNNFILSNPKGFGYWIWKPYIIKKYFDKVNDNDILLYLVSGCEIDYREGEYFKHCLDIVTKDLIVGTFGKTNVEESCKMDLLLKLQMNQDIYLKSKMHQAGANLFLVCPETRKLINEWYELSQNYKLIDDSPSESKNLLEFKEHRHDQSIYSLLTKKYKLYSDTKLDAFCIKCLRNRSGVIKIIF